MDERRLLVTPDDLRTYDYARRVEELHDGAAGDTLALAALGAAQDGLRAHLGYDPLVHRVRRRRLRWAYPSGQINGRAVTSDGVPWEAYGAGTGPIVQVDASPYVPTGSPADYYTVAVSDDGTRIEVDAADPLPAYADLYEGWRGAHHTLTDPPPAGHVLLTDLDGLDGLTALPPLLADTFAAAFAAICEAAIYYALRPALLGVESVEVDVGAQVKRMERVRPLTSELRDIYAPASGRRRVNA